MTFKRLVNLYDRMDDPACDGERIAAYLRECGPCRIELARVEGKKPGTFTDFVKVLVAGRSGRTAGGAAPTLGVIGRLGGIGARPERIGFVSDGDGALVALTAAAKLAVMAGRGDVLEGDVIVATQVSTHAPTSPHDPVPFMGSCVDQPTKNRYEVDPAMDAILSVDTTKGNRIVNTRGFAISPTVKEGWLLRVSEDLLGLMAVTTGRLPVTFPLTQQDITPYGNGVYHMNSILQPAAATSAPCVGVAITAETQVPGCATGVSHLSDMEEAARFMVEAAKDFTAGRLSFYNEAEFGRLVALYGDMKRFQTTGKEVRE